MHLASQGSFFHNNNRMPYNVTRARSDTQQAPGTRTCDMPNCTACGEYRAPRGHFNLRDYFWFCLDHVREYNKNWDYFDGMSAAQIEAFMKDAVTGHRPTWKREEKIAYTADQLMDELDRFMGWRSARRQTEAPIHGELNKEQLGALSVMDLEDGYTLAELKTRYKQLVKLHHPDINPGNPQAEERFKKITASYVVLAERLKDLEKDGLND